MIQKQVNDTTIDVFTGKGWDNWTRFEVSHKHGRLFLKMVKGTPMSKEDFKKLYEELNK